MTDIVDPATRSRMMSGIRGRDTEPELRIRKALHAHGFRYRIHHTRLPGKPDIVLPRFRAVVLVHGCFWHGHDCPLFRLPGTRTEFWREKITRNRARDRDVAIALGDANWRRATVWECSLRGPQRLDFDTVIDELADWLRNGRGNLELRGIHAGPSGSVATPPNSRALGSVPS
ncbi:MAG: DNA mismatch endonuclease Vsr [Rhodospirillaceae bacterium]|nr:DNA mismatch endonuclease Vsr [Rhodospirillaceae bacterium]